MSGPRVLGVLVSTLVIGGAEQVLLKLLGGLDRSRYSPRLYCLREPGPIGLELEAMGVPLFAGLAPKFPAAAPFTLARRFSRDRLDILLMLNHRDCMVYGVPAARMAGVGAVVNWQHETNKRHRFHELFMFVRRGLVWGMDAVVAAARGHARYLVDVERTPIRKVLAIPNGVDVASCRSALCREEARARLGLPLGAKAAGIMAALRPDKGHEYFLEAAAKTLAKVPEAYFLVVGDGPRRAFLEELAGRLGLGGRVRFLGFRRDMADILAALDIGVLSSKPEQETLSIAAMEAMAAGVPMVCTDVGFLSEVVVPERTGLLVPPRDPMSLAAAMTALLTDDDRRLAMGRRAARKMAEEHSLSVMAAGFESLFEDVAARVPPRRRLPLCHRSACIGVTWREAGKWELLGALRGRLEKADAVCVSRKAEKWLSRLPALRRFAHAAVLAWVLFRQGRRHDALASWSITPGTFLGLILRCFPRKVRPLHICRDFHLDPDRSGPAYRLRLFLLRLALPGMDEIWCTSEAERERYAGMFGLDPARFSFYPDEPPSRFLAEPETPPGDYVFAYGNSDRDFSTLFKAAGSFGRKLVVLSQARDFPENPPADARVIRERVSEDELIRLIQGAALVVAPTKSRELAAGQNVLLEGMALARPVAAAANVATLEYGRDGVEALFYRPGDAGDLAAKARELLDDPERAAAMGRRARAKAGELLASQPDRFLRFLEDGLRRSGK